MVFTTPAMETSTSTPATWTGKMWFVSPPSWVTTVAPSFHLTGNGWCGVLLALHARRHCQIQGTLQGMVEPTSMELFVARTDGRVAKSQNLEAPTGPFSTPTASASCSRPTTWPVPIQHLHD